MASDSERVHAHLPVNPRDYLILFSMLEGARHGYGVIREVEAQSEGLVRMDPSNLYRAVRRLIRDDLLEEVDAPEADADEVKRRYFQVTPLGGQVVRAEAARLRTLTEVAESKNLLPNEAR